MNNYHFLVFEREQGRYDEYMRRGLISVNIDMWMDVYQFHIDHPNASTWLVANSLEINQTHVRNIYNFMEGGEKNEH